MVRACLGPGQGIRPPARTAEWSPRSGAKPGNLGASIAARVGLPRSRCHRCLLPLKAGSEGQTTMSDAQPIQAPESLVMTVS